jgi:RNA polymerase sigma-70 factor, ECF subfamily
MASVSCLRSDRVSPAVPGIYTNLTAPPEAAFLVLRDRALVDRAKSGDQAAFGEFVRRHQGRIYRVIAHMLRNTAVAEEIAQETFVRAFRAIASFDGRSEPYTWVYRIGVNLALNEIRSRKSRGTPSDVDDPRLSGFMESHENPSEATERKRMYIVLCEGIDSLTEALRVTMILVCIDGLSHDAASQVLGIPEGTIAWRVHEARKRLREHMKKCGIDVDLA